MKRHLLVALFLISVSIPVVSQNTRINHNNTIGWYNYFGTFKLANKFSLHTEYQLRRDQLILERQQNLLRLGLNFNFNSKVMFRMGYANIKTFPYGEYPINVFGKDFIEHRIYEMVQLSHKKGIVNLAHRFILEQRFVGRYSSVSIKDEDEFPLFNRARYMLRLQFPLRGREIKDRTPYLAVYDEIFIGFGDNPNVFDQNRIGILVGYSFNKNLRIEGGYINQTLQFARKISNQDVFQINNGLLLNGIINLNFTD